MGLSRTSVIIFRVMLVLSLLLIIYLATAELEHPVMTSVNDKFGHILAFVILAFLLGGVAAFMYYQAYELK